MNKILFYTMSLEKGGAERVISNLANTFIGNYDVTIVTNINGKSYYKLDEKIKHISIDYKKGNKILSKLSNKRTKRLFEIIKEEKPDIIISFLPEPTIRLLSLKKYFNNIKMIVSIRNNPKYEFPLFLKYIRNHYYKFADYIVIQSDSYKNYLNNKLKNKCITIPNYIKDDFNVKSSKKENIIVSVGRLERQKNYKLLIKVFYKINKKYSDYKLYIYGDGSKRKKLQKYIDKKDLHNKVILKGIKDNINKEIVNCKIFVLTSRYEGMPNALLEAMSLSLPCVTTLSSPAILEIIKNKENGIIAKNYNELVNSIDTLLSDEEYMNKLGKSAYKICKIYNEKDILKKWYELIKI